MDITRIEQIIDEIEEPKTVTITVSDIQDLHKVTTHPSNKVTTKTEYRLLIARFLNSKEIIRIVDPDYVISTGMHELCIKPIPQPQNLFNFSSWQTPKNKLISPTIYEKTSIYDTKEMFAHLKKNNLTFKELLTFLIDDTTIKDERIIDLVKSSLLLIPLSLREIWQPFNNHAFVLTNTSAAKSTSFYRVNGIEPTSDVTHAGLIGGFTKDKGIRAGSLNGSGNFPVDEFPEQRNPIFNQILNYTVHGETIRTLVEPIECRGTKSLIFLGNSEEGICTGKELKEKIIGLATGKTLGRIGSRFCHIYYGNDFNIVTPTHSNYTVVKKARIMCKDIINQNASLIMAFIDHKIFHEWLSIPDKKYFQLFEYLASLTTFSDLNDFLLGHRYAVPKIKFASIKLALLDNLEIIIENPNPSIDVRKEVLSYAQIQYEKFKSYNIKSFAFLEENKKTQVLKLLQDKVPIPTIITKTGISRATIFRWKADVKQLPLKKRRLQARAQELIQKAKGEMK